MKKIVIFVLALIFVLSFGACGRVSQRQVEKMIEEAVEEAIEEQADEMKDEDDDKDDDKEAAKEDEEGSDSSGFTAAYSYSEDEVPENFPVDAIPLYEDGDSKIVGSGAVTAGNDVVYSVGIVTKADPKDVAKDIEEQLKKIYKKDEMNKIAMGDFAMFVVGSDEWNFTVTLGSASDEGYDDYETIINYTTVSD